MNKKELIESYFKGLEAGDYNQVIQLFTEDAVVYSPLYGKIKAASFYKDLFEDTERSKITLKTIFVSAMDSPFVAAHFLFDWILKDGTPAPFECVDVFELDLASGKIKSLKIIYDTYRVRPAFTELSSKS